MKPEKALSVRQPWAWLYLTYKPVENRNWAIGRKTQYGPYSSSQQADFYIPLPCRVYIHAAKKYEHEEFERAFKIVEEIYGQDKLRVIKANYLNHLELGAIIGEATIVRQITKDSPEAKNPLIKPWFEGKYGFVREKPELYERPIPCRGQLGFFKPEIGEAEGRVWNLNRRRK